jgi:lysophospholipase L1-like esterase
MTGNDLTPPAAHRPGSGRLLKVLVPVLALAVTLGALEAAFRIAEAMTVRRAGESWATYDADIGYRLNPNVGDTNAHGLRDHAVTPKAGRFRLLMLGDSVAYYGDDVDDTYVAHLRRLLQSSSRAPSIDVLNAGIRGYTNYQELLFLKKYGLTLEPDLVGVGFVLNDLHKILHQFKVEDGRIVGETYEFTPEAVGTVDSWLYQAARKSRLLVWARRRLDTVVAMVEHNLEQGYAFDYRPDVNTAWKDHFWPSIETQLREMTALGRSNGFGLFVVIFPFADQYRAEYRARDVEYVMKPQRMLREICERLDVPYLDLYESLDPGHLEADRIHLTKSGRVRAAEAIASFLSSRGLVPHNAARQDPR